MSKRIIGLTVELRQAVIRAFGYVSSDAECIENPENCCGGGGLTGTGIGSGCCADSDPEDEIGFSLEGPIYDDCGTGSMSGAFELIGGGGFSWGGEGTFGALIAILSGTVYCAGDGFRFGGSITPPTDPPFFFDIELVLDPVTGMFTGIITRPGCEEPIIVSFTPPCTGSVSWNCVEGACEAVTGPDGTYASNAACLAACGSSWNCTDGSCVEVPGNTGTYDNLIACQIACGEVVTFNCSSLECVPVSGSGGTYANIGDCVAGCGTRPCNACPSPLPIGKTIGVTISGGCGITSPVTLTANAFAFAGSTSTPATPVIPMTVGCQVLGGLRKWSVSFSSALDGTFTGGTGVLFATADCNILTGTVNVTCLGVPVTLTVTVNDYFFCTNPPC